MKKILHGIADILSDKRGLRDGLSLLLGFITMIIGILILVHSNVFYHNFAGFLVVLAGITNIVIAAIPIQEWRRIESASFVVVIYGLLKSQSVVAKTIGLETTISIICLFGVLIFLVDWLAKKRGE